MLEQKGGILAWFGRKQNLIVQKKNISKHLFNTCHHGKKTRKGVNKADQFEIPLKDHRKSGWQSDCNSISETLTGSPLAS